MQIAAYCYRPPYVQERKRRNLAKTLMVMRLTGILLLTACLHVTAGAVSQTITLSAKGVEINKVFDAVKKQTGYAVFYNKGLLLHTRPVSVSARDMPLKDFLSTVLENQPLDFFIENKTIFIRRRAKAAENKETPPIEAEDLFQNIKGTVVNEKGQPLAGVTVTVKGTNMATATDENGNFSLGNLKKDAVLVFSNIGFQHQEHKVGNGGDIRIVLLEGSDNLNEVMIVGYGVQKKKSVTGAVSSIGTRELLQSPAANISNSLAGRLPGLFAVQSSGEPGNDQSTLRIRGIGTFNGSADPLIMVDGIEVTNYNNIDPNEIANITILKDASSTAIYGVRGANGVLLITTKRGKVGIPQVSLTSNVAITKFIGLREQMNSADYTRSYNEGLKYDSYITNTTYTPRFSDEDIALYKSGKDPVFHPSTDWYKVIFKPSSRQTQYNVSISGGMERVKYFVSAGYFNQEGLFNHTDLTKDFDSQRKFKRYNFRSNFNFEITKRLRAALDLSSQTEAANGANWADNTILVNAAAVGNPIFSPGIVDGKIVELRDLTFASPMNPLAVLLSSGYRKEYRNYLNGSVRMDFDMDFITKGLSAHGTISYQNFSSQVKSYGKNLVTYKPVRLPDNSINYVPLSLESPFGFTETIGKNRRTYAEFGFDYKREFGDHTVTGLILYNQTRRVDPTLAFLIPNGYQGVVGRVTYDYKGRYLGEVNMGYNGTENFAEGKRFGLFPAYSAGWVVSKEKFFPDNDVVSFLKIRGSYGEVGNDKVGGARFLYRPTSFTYSGGYYFGEEGSNYTQYSTSIEGALGNPGLTWERAVKKNLGVEMAVWKNKLNLTFDFFSERRENILATPQTTPSVTGAILPQMNLGKMKNSGFEGELSFNSRAGNFTYWVKANFSYAHNVILYQDEIPNPQEYQLRTGRRLGQYFGLLADGLYNSWDEINDPKRPVSSYNTNRIQPGDIRYKDYNKDGIIDYKDQVPIGYSNFPEKMAGISLGGSYKGFDFSVMFMGATNVSVNYSLLAVNGFEQGFAAPAYLDQSWSKERYDKGLPIRFPHLSIGWQTNNHNSKTSTFWLADASYIRLKNAEIGYTLTGNLLKKIGLNSARIYVNGNNLLTWSHMLPGVDPEQPTTVNANNYTPYPLTRTMNAGLNVKF